MVKRRIAVITGTRAEYGLLYGVMKELQQHGADVQLIVTGAHLSAQYGMTAQQIQRDGWPIAARVDMQLAGDTPVELAGAMGKALAGIAQALGTIAPDIVVILGDRYEMMAAACAAAMLHIPIAHIHGGEETQGAQDNAWRHAITKLSYWHFAPYALAGERIRQMGEAPERVFVTGAPGIDAMARVPVMPQKTLERELGITLKAPVMLFTYHPEELALIAPLAQIDAVLSALEAFPQATLIMTGANADGGGQAINGRLQTFAATRRNSVFRMSLGSVLYVNAMRACDIVIGNSSSAMIEAPALGKMAVNIGNRQGGRLRTEHSIDCVCEKGSIVQAVSRALGRASEPLVPSTAFGVPGKVSAHIAALLMDQALPQTPAKNFSLL